MSILDKFVDYLGPKIPIETVVDFDQSSNPVIEHSSQLFSADFSRDGADLVLSNFGQLDIRLPNYFGTDNPADIHTKDGKVLSGEVVEKLAGPEFPAQYAQASATSDAAAIGQVEAISGDVTVLRASGVRETLSLGAKVFANDVVQTGAGGALSLTFIDGTIFTLAESSRMVLDSLIYDPASSENSGIFNLVEGSFVFIAGEVAKTGGMEVKTPAATMGIRGTTVLVKISSTNGVTEVEASLNQDPDGSQGKFTITDNNGSKIPIIDSTDTKWIISSVKGQTREVKRTPEELSDDQNFLNQAVSAYQSAIQRVEDGGDFVETDASGTQTLNNDPNVAPPEVPQEPTNEDNQGEDDRRGNLSGGINDELASDSALPDSTTDQVGITQFVAGGKDQSIGGVEASSNAVAPVEEQPENLDGAKSEPAKSESTETEPLIDEDVPAVDDPVPQTNEENTSPDIDPPTVTIELLEDGSIELSGFDISDDEDDILTATITAGSSLTLNPGSGVTIIQGSGVDDTVIVIQGTGEQISNALNGATYKPTADADVSGSLTVEVSDGEFSTTDVTTIPITPVQDAPVAVADVLVADENASSVTGNILANDFDVDTNPTPDELTVTSVTVNGETHDLSSGPVTISVANGASITISSDGSYVFNTNNAFDAMEEGEVISETISYTISDGHEADHGQIVTGELTVTITGTNDAPVVTGDGQISLIEDHSYTLTQEDLQTVDLEDSPTNLVYTVTGGLASGQLELNSAPGTAITTFTQQQLDDGEVVYVHNGSTGTTDTFSFTVTDGLATVGGSVNVAITQFNDDPSGSGLPISLTITEDTAASLDISSLSLSDPDAENSSVKLILDAENSTLSATSTAAVTVTSTATGLIIEGSIADLNNALSDPAFITITPDEDLNGFSAASVTVRVNDNGNSGIGGGSDIEIGEIAVNITAANDVPTLTVADQETGYVENDADTIITTSVSISDSDDTIIEFAVVRISENFQVGDVLNFIDTETITGHYDASTGILTLTGSDTLANYEAALESLTYSNGTDDISEDVRTISYLVDDGDGNSNQVTATILPTAVNDAPVVAALPEFDFTEDESGSIVFSSAVISDPDAGNSEISLTISVDSGTLTFPPGTGITISGNTLTGTVADINQYLVHGGTDGNTITYEPELNNTDPVQLTLTVDDQGNSGDGGALTDTASTTINIEAVNDAPVLTEIPIEFEVDEDITQDINFYDLEPFGETFSDPDAADNLVEFTFTLSSGELTFPPGGAGITISGNTITGTVAAINDYLNNGGTDGTFVRFTTDQDSTEDVSLNITVNDLGNTGSGGPMSDSVDVDIIVNPVDDPAEVTLSEDTNSYLEDHAPVVIDSAVSVTDVDSTTLVQAGVAITENFEAGTDILSFTDTATITGSYDATTGVLILTGTDTIAAYEAALSSVTYHSTSDDPDTQDRTILFNVDDGAGFGYSDTITVSVTSSNDAPEINANSIAASAEQVSNGGFQDGIYDTEYDNILSNGSTNITDWIVTDDNVQYQRNASGERTVSLNGDEPGAISTTISTTVGQTYEVSFQGLGDGTLDVVATGGTTENYEFTSDSNGKYYSYTFTATAAATTLTFTSTTAGTNGPTLDDVTVREVVGGSIDVVEDTPIEISDIQITDTDADVGATFTVTLSSSYGRLWVNDNVQSGVDSTNISDNGSYSVTLTGSLDQINETLAAADGVTYTPNLDFNGEDTIEVTVNDGGSSGSGGPQTGTETITLNVQPVDDDPQASSDVGDIVEGNVTNLTGIQFVGNDGDTVGNSVTNVGDINNDGIDDFAIGSSASSGESGTPSFSGSVYVIYGVEGSNPYASYANEDGEVNLDNVVADGGGFELVGAASGDQAGFSVSGGGDINNDGISDLVVGAYFTDSPLNSGTAYVVYGGQDFDSLADDTTGEISLSTVGVTGTSTGNLDGFKFEHTDSNANLGYDVSLTGDLNGDGISDLVVSSVGNSSSAYNGTWVVFGGQDFSSATDASTGAFDVSEIGTSIDGFLLQGETSTDSAGLSVEVIGDVNGDGIDDLLVGAPDNGSGGASYVIYGGQDWESLKNDTFPAEIGLDQLGTSAGDLQGFKIEGSSAGESLGITVSDAGDVNGDGTTDILVTSTGDTGGSTSSSAYLIYGGQSLSGTVSASLIGSGGTGSVDGYVLTNSVAGESITHATALGDINGDGYSDILVGVKTADDGSDMNVGKSYVIFGSSVASSGTSSLSDIVASGGGFEITGEAAGDLLGSQVQSVGDVNSDGYNDFIVTAIGNDDGGTGAGAAYLIYGSDYENKVDQVAGADTETGSSGNDVIHGTEGDDVIDGGGGNDVIITGAGDDTIIIGDDTVAYIDAGSGTDTLVFDDAGSFDLTNVNDSRLQSIEALDTANGVVNDVTLGITDIFQISDDANSELETLLGEVLPTSFIIDADANDTYTFENGSAGGVWTLNVAKSADVAGYDVYEYVESGSADVLATLAIDDDVTPTIV